METRANYAVIGLFTLAVIAAVFGFVYWFSVTTSGEARREVRIIFSGSVAGLNRGSFVTFNGLRVGEVTDIRLLPEDPGRVVARVEVDRATPLRADTRARLEYQGLTGVAQVALAGGEGRAAALEAHSGQERPTIFAERSDFQDLMETARTIARRADDVLAKVDDVVTENRSTITATLRNVEQFSQALSNNAPQIDRFLARVGEAAERIGPLANKLETLTTNLNGVVEAVEPQAVANTVKNVESVTAALAQNRDNLNQVMANAATLTQRLNESSVKLDQTLADVGGLVRSVDGAKLNSAISNVEGFSKTLADNRETVDRILQNSAGLTERLNATAVRVDTALEDVSRLVNTVDTGKLNGTIGNVEAFTKTLSDNRENVAAILRDAAKLASSLDTDRINRTVANAERFTAALGDSSDDTKQVIANAVEISEKLNRSADRVDGVLKAAEGFLGSGAGGGAGGMFQEVRDAAVSIRRLADNLDRRTAEITTGINKFTGPGLQEFRDLAGEGKRAIGEIGRAVRSLERNPQQLLFGGKSNIPEYNARR